MNRTKIIMLIATKIRKKWNKCLHITYVYIYISHKFSHLLMVYVCIWFICIWRYMYFLISSLFLKCIYLEDWDIERDIWEIEKCFVPCFSLQIFSQSDLVQDKMKSQAPMTLASIWVTEMQVLGQSSLHSRTISRKQHQKHEVTGVKWWFNLCIFMSASFHLLNILILHYTNRYTKTFFF